ncbi:MAG: cytochrome c family protein [Rhodobacteraceae bacterium]|nr:cytochrome c family protein [Paracoccaceae bacterium]
MLDTMTATKIVGALCGAMLVLLLGKWAAESIYHVGPIGHGDDHGAVPIFADIAEDQLDTPVEEVVDILTLLASADIAKGAKVFAKCKACHKVEESTNGVGPHLVGIVGRQIGIIDEFKYSNPMADLEGVWDPEQLAAFLANPKKYLPGTKMSFVGLKKPKDRANIIAWMQSLQ